MVDEPTPLKIIIQQERFDYQTDVKNHITSPQMKRSIEGVDGLISRALQKANQTKEKYNEFTSSTIRTLSTEQGGV